MTRLATKATAATAPVRTRTRPAPKLAPVVTETKAKGTNKRPTANMKKDALSYYDHNTKKNAENRETERLKKLLWPAMAEAGFDANDGGFSIPLSDDGRTLKVEIVEADEQFVDPEKLLAEVGMERFMTMVSCPQTAVDAEVGQNIRNKCLSTRKAKPTLSIKEVK